MNLVLINDADDARLAVFRDIRERDLARRGDFIAEGAVVLDHLLTAPGFEATAILVSQHRLAGLQKRFAGLELAMPVYVAPQAVMDGIAGFSVHRGIVAHGRRRMPAQAPVPSQLGGGPVIVAAGLSNHDNMGALFRNGAAFGASAVMLDARCCDPLYRKSIRVSVGTVLKLPFFRLGAAEDIVAMLQAAGRECVALSPAGVIRLDRWAPRRPVALVLGAEGEGLSPSVMARCTTLAVAMAPGLDSLNVSVAASIALHHLFTMGRGA